MQMSNISPGSIKESKQENPENSHNHHDEKQDIRHFYWFYGVLFAVGLDDYHSNGTALHIADICTFALIATVN